MSTRHYVRGRPIVIIRYFDDYDDGRPLSGIIYRFADDAAATEHWLCNGDARWTSETITEGTDHDNQQH